MYEQTAKALARIDESLALCGSDKSKILSAIVYIADMKRKGEMNRAWDEWVDSQESADARLHRRRARTAAYRGDRGDGGEVSGWDVDEAYTASFVIASEREAIQLFEAKQGSGLLHRCAPRNDVEWKRRSIRVPDVRLLRRLHQLETLLDLAEQRGKILALLRRRGRTGSPAPGAAAAGSVPRTALCLCASCAAQIRGGRPHSRRARPVAVRISAVTARLMVDLWVRVQCAMYCALQRIVAEAERRQHAPFRDVEAVALLVFAGAAPN